jgi:hypothetical protein
MVQNKQAANNPHRSVLPFLMGNISHFTTAKRHRKLPYPSADMAELFYYRWP